jgi:pimeloyl-ACP methyl ester carboxylesterase
VPIVEHLCGLGGLPPQGFRFYAAPPMVAGMGTFPVRAFAIVGAVPVQIVQGDQDRVMPPEATGNRMAVMLADARLTVIPEGGHAIIWTHAAEVNRALVGFVRAAGYPAPVVGDQTEPVR